MMINGIHITATFKQPKPFTDEWLEAIYMSVQRNIAIVSADMFVDEDANSVAFHLGIDCQLQTSESFVEDVAEEALTKAFNDAQIGLMPQSPPTVVSGRVEVFA